MALAVSAALYAADFTGDVNAVRTIRHTDSHPSLLEL